MKTGNLLLLILLWVGISQAQNTKSANIYFGFDKFDLQSYHLDSLEKLISLEEGMPDSIRIEGFADTIAPKSYNEQLALKRAESVQAFFISKGFQLEQMHLNSWGERKAQSAADMGTDRRVHIQLFYPIPVPKEPAHISELYELTEIKPQIFCINPKRDTILQCKKGAIIHIPAQAFQIQRLSRSQTPCIEFEVKEAYSPSEIILENLSTASEGRILETQGMIFTSAKIDGNELDIQKDITILMPTDTVIPGVQIFDGQRGPHSDEMNWTVQNQSQLRNFSVSQLYECRDYRQYWQACIAEGQENLVRPEDIYNYCLDCLLRCLIDCIRVDNPCERCRFFWCRLKRYPMPFKGMVDAHIRRENRSFRACQRRLREIEKYEKTLRESLPRPQLTPGRRNLEPAQISENLRRTLEVIEDQFIRKEAREGKVEKTELEKRVEELTTAIAKSDSLIRTGNITYNMLYRCNELDSLFKAYGVDHIEALVYEINRPLMDEFAVSTFDELMDTLPKVNLNQLEVAYENKNISFRDYQFYVFNTSNLGWKNIDVFADIPANKMVRIEVDMDPLPDTDCKIVFKDRSFVLTAKVGREGFYFDRLPVKESAWLVGLKYQDGQPLLAMEPIVIRKNGSYQMNFQEKSLKELKAALTVLDFN